MTALRETPVTPAHQQHMRALKDARTDTTTRYKQLTAARHAAERAAEQRRLEALRGEQARLKREAAARRGEYELLTGFDEDPR